LIDARVFVPRALAIARCGRMMLGGGLPNGRTSGRTVC